MFDFPPNIYKQLTFYLLPLFALSLSYNPAVHYSRLFFLSVVSSALQYYCAEPLIPRKLSLVASALLCLLAILLPRYFFFSYGFILSQAYNAHIIISDARPVSGHVFKTHVLGLFIARCIVIPIYVQVALAAAVVAASILATSPAIEAADPYAAMQDVILGPDRQERITADTPIDMSTLGASNKVILGNSDEDINKHVRSSSYGLLCREFKAYVKGGFASSTPQLGIFHTLFLLSQGSALLFLLSLLNLFPTRYFSLAICAAAAMCWSVLGQELYVWLSLFADFGSSRDIPTKLASGYILYLALDFVRVV